jgi:biotin carboxyl carrier protein
MKMQNAVVAPLDGTIKTIFVREGQQVPRGYILVEFE